MPGYQLYSNLQTKYPNRRAPGTSYASAYLKADPLEAYRTRIAIEAETFAIQEVYDLLARGPYQYRLAPHIHQHTSESDPYPWLARSNKTVLLTLSDLYAPATPLVADVVTRLLEDAACRHRRALKSRYRRPYKSDQRQETV
jgi:hypothetical protein